MNSKYVSVLEATPSQSYRLCHWTACRTYATKNVQDHAANEAHLTCDKHLDEILRELTESIYR